MCPPMPSPPADFVPAKRGGSVPPKEGAEYGGTVTVLVVISDKGFVCGATVLRGIDSRTDRQALDSVRGWQFSPAKKDGRTVPVVATLGVNVWRADGEVFFQQAGKPNPH